VCSTKLLLLYWCCKCARALASCMVLHRLYKFRNIRVFRGGNVDPTPKPQPGGTGATQSDPYRLNCQPWVTLPGAYTPASTALRVTGARKPPLHDKAVVPELYSVTTKNTALFKLRVLLVKIICWSKMK
jgi:hypothetical protein